jgi:hypothetical protein
MNQNQNKTQKRFNCKNPNWLEVQRSQCIFPIGGSSIYIKIPK